MMDRDEDFTKAFRVLVGNAAGKWREPLFLDQWLVVHRALIRHAYVIERILYWKCAPHDAHCYRMSIALKAACVEYLKIRNKVFG